MSKPDVLDALTAAYRACAAGRPMFGVALETALSRCPVSKPQAYAFLRNPANCARLAAALGLTAARYSPGWYHASGAGQFGRLGGSLRGTAKQVKPSLFLT